jgi:hypothetical protein
MFAFHPMRLNFDPLVKSVNRTWLSSIQYAPDNAPGPSLGPCCFGAGEARDKVVDRLRRSGFIQRTKDHWPEAWFDPRYLGVRYQDPSVQLYSAQGARVCRLPVLDRGEV